MVGLIICNSIPIIWCKDCENLSSGSWDSLAPSEQVQYQMKLVAMATSLEEPKKTGPYQENSRKYLPFRKKFVKIGPVDTEIALLIVKKRKKEEINASKIYSPVVKFAEQAKKRSAIIWRHYRFIRRSIYSFRFYWWTCVRRSYICGTSSGWRRRTNCGIALHSIRSPTCRYLHHDLLLPFIKRLLPPARPPAAH